MVEVPILAATSTGERFAIALSGPLTNDYPGVAALLTVAPGKGAKMAGRGAPALRLPYGQL
jgi:hypothetical protein